VKQGYEHPVKQVDHPTDLTRVILSLGTVERLRNKDLVVVNILVEIGATSAPHLVHWDRSVDLVEGRMA
jgi:hypothetical protein